MNLTAPKCDPNNPAMSGKSASRKVLFGPCSRYAVYAVHTRFDAVQWFVADAEDPATDGQGWMMAIIRQEWTFDAATSGLI